MAKPKAKSPEERQATLDNMLSLAVTSNHLDAPTPAGPKGGSTTTPAPETTPDNQEQKGENISVTSVAATAPTASGPAAELAASIPAAEPTAVALTEPEPISEPTAMQPVLAAAEPEQVAAVPDEENSPESESLSETIPEPAATVDAGNLDLASLFMPADDKKVFTMRLTDAQYQYLLLLGTIVGNRTSPPDIVYNIIAQFIDKNDAQIQKAIAKQLRQRQSKK